MRALETCLLRSSSVTGRSSISFGLRSQPWQHPAGFPPGPVAYRRGPTPPTPRMIRSWCSARAHRARSRRLRSPCRSALRVAGELLEQEIGEDLDPLRSRAPGRRDPVDSTGWQRPIGQQSFQPAGGECIAQNEFGQDADTGPGNQGRQHRVTIIHPQRTRWPHRRGFAVLGEAPSLRRYRVAVPDAAMLGEVNWITGGSPYGATTITGGDGSRLPTADELEGASYQGRKITANLSPVRG
jgi:hypothetical protein